MNINIFSKCHANWIWLPQETIKMNQYVEFRQEFEIREAGYTNADLYLSVDTEYAIWLNGKFLSFGQYDDFPDHKVYDAIPVSEQLEHGRNVICVLAYYQGEKSFQYKTGSPRLIYTIDTGQQQIVSGNNTYCRESTNYQCGPVSRISPQLSFSFEYSAITRDGWICKEYEMEDDWQRAVSLPENERPASLKKRPIKKLIMKPRVNSVIQTQGVFLRTANQNKTIAQRMQTDFLSSRHAGEIFRNPDHVRMPSADGIQIHPDCANDGQGIYFVIDMGREETGFLNLELDAEAGTQVEIAYGEHLDDLRVRSAIGSRNFAAGYICAEGHQTFTHFFKRITGRYLQLHIIGIHKKFTLYYAGIRPVEYPVKIQGYFKCTDHLFNRIHDVSARTLHLCMHEHYEDTPWREQALYGMDSMIQALCGYYIFGDPDFPVASFALLGESLRDDGFLDICAPADHDQTIPSFSMAWIMEVWDYFLYTGNIDRVVPLSNKIETMLDSYLSRLEHNLMPTPMGKRYWNFYEWSYGMDGYDMSYNTTDRKTVKRFDAPLNLFLVLALRAGESLEKYCGNADHAEKYHMYREKICNEFHNQFWVESLQCYQTYLGTGRNVHYSELVQSLAICAGACPEEKIDHIRRMLTDKDNHLVKVTLNTSLFKYHALMTDAKTYAKTVFDDIADNWGYMLYHGATSFWETMNGANDFDRAGSLSHGWSAIPLYFFYAYLLGVKPLKPGFQTFTVKPAFWIGCNAKGKVPTPYGDIYVSWQNVNGELQLQLKKPKELILKKQSDSNASKNF